MRTTITLPDHLHAAAEQKAAQQGLSLSAYIQKLVEDDLQHRDANVDPSAIFDLFNSGGSDIGRFKHSMIQESVDNLYRPKGV